MTTTSTITPELLDQLLANYKKPEDLMHVGTALQQVRGERVPQSVRRDPGAKARCLCRHVADAVQLPCRDRQERITAREQPTLRPTLQPTCPEQLEQLW